MCKIWTKIPNCLGKMSEKLRVFLHTLYIMYVAYSVLFYRDKYKSWCNYETFGKLLISDIIEQWSSISRESVSITYLHFYQSHCLIHIFGTKDGEKVLSLTHLTKGIIDKWTRLFARRQKRQTDRQTNKQTMSTQSNTTKEMTKKRIKSYYAVT